MDLQIPRTPDQWRVHTRLIHGVWLSPSAPVEELWEFHEGDHADPNPGQLPHTHIGPATADVGEHGFW
jgi:hypothetical protein